MMKQLMQATCVFTALAALSVPAYAVDGVTLINQATVTAAGGFPYSISQSGSYRLSGNLVSASATTAMILISAPNVTLDFNGFSVSCPNCASSDTAVVNSNTLGTALMNGTIQVSVGSTATCVSLGPNAKVTNMTIEWCQTGIQTPTGGSTLTVSNSMFYGIGGTCVDTSSGLLTVINSTFDSCGKIGVLVGGGALITGNTFLSGAGSFFAIGITVQNGATAVANVTNNMISGGNAGVVGPAGVGSNTFEGLPAHAEMEQGAVSMKNNVCASGVC